MKDTNETYWVVTWKSPGQRNRKQVVFGDSCQARRWYDEKIQEGRKPKLFSCVQTKTYSRMD